MASSQQLVYLPEDSDVAASLEVIRRLLQPSSSSLPHITLRHSSKPMRSRAVELYSELPVTDLVLDQVATFDSTPSGAGIETLIILCDSETLEHVSYRPDFPQSLFHLSLYVGPPSQLASRMLTELQGLSWNLKFSTALRTFRSSKEASESSSLRQRFGALLTTRAALLYEQACRQLHVYPDISENTDDDKLRIASHVAQALHNSSDVVRHVPSASTDSEDFGLNLRAHGVESESTSLRRLAAGDIGQMAFWSEEDIRQLSPSSDLPRSPSLRSHSTFITPPELSLEVVDAALEYLRSDDLIDFGDPAIGAGIFYAGLRHRVGPDGINSARGVEIDPGSAARTLHRWRRTPLSVLVGDFLEQVPETDTWNLVLANPPYRRSQLIQSDLAKLRQGFATDLDLPVSGRSDLYVYFLLRAHAWMKEGAIGAWVIPSEFQVTDYGQALRTYLSRNVQLLRIHTYEQAETQFDNALTSTAVVIFQKLAPSTNHHVRISHGGTLRRPVRQRVELLSSLLLAPRWSFQFLSKPPPNCDTEVLGSFFSVKRGLATGANGIFVLTHEDVQAMEVDRRWIRPILPRAATVDQGVVPAESSRFDRPDSGRWLIDSDWSLERIETKSPLFGQYLRERQGLAMQSVLVQRRTPFYRQERQETPEMVFVYMAKSSVDANRRFISNESQCVALNNYLVLTPHPGFRRRIEDLGLTMTDVRHVLARIPPQDLASEGRVYGRALLKLEPREVARLKLPRDEIWSNGVS